MKNKLFDGENRKEIKGIQISDMNRIHQKQEPLQISIQEVFFYGYFITMLLIKGLGYADGQIYKCGLLLALLFAMGKLVLTSYTKGEWVMLISLLGLSVINRMRTGLDSEWFVILLLLTMKNISVRRTMRVGATMWPALFLFQVVTHLAGLRSFDYVIHNKFGLGYVIRWAMGYVHPNVLQISYNVVVFYLVYSLCRSKKSLKKAFWISLLGAIYIFLYSFSLTGMLMFAAFWFFAFGLLWCRERRLAGRGERILIMAILPAEATAAILLPLVLRGRAFDALEKLMTHRPSLTRYFFTTYGVSLLGQNPKGLISNYTLDCSYAYLLFHGGILLFIVLLSGYLILIHKETRIYDENSSLEATVELAITLACLTGAVSEPFAFNTSFKNVSLIFLGHAVYSMGKEKKEYGLTRRWQRASQNSETAACICQRIEDFIRSLCGRLRKSWHRDGKKVVLVGLIAGLLGTVVYWSHADRVREYYSCRVNTDAGEEQKEGVYLTREQVQELQEDPAVRVLSYRDDKTQMVSFDGRIGQVEWGRGLLSAALWSFIIGAGAFLAAWCVREKTTEREISDAGNAE